MVFQKNKNIIFRAIVSFYNQYPKILGPVFKFIAPILLRNFDKLYIKYAIEEGLLNIHFGYPEILKENEVNTINSRIISPRFSKSFILGKT